MKVTLTFFHTVCAYTLSFKNCLAKKNKIKHEYSSYFCRVSRISYNLPLTVHSGWHKCLAPHSRNRHVYVDHRVQCQPGLHSSRPRQLQKLPSMLCGILILSLSGDMILAFGFVFQDCFLCVVLTVLDQACSVSLVLELKVFATIPAIL